MTPMQSGEISFFWHNMSDLAFRLSSKPIQMMVNDQQMRIARCKLWPVDINYKSLITLSWGVTV